MRRLLPWLTSVVTATGALTLGPAQARAIGESDAQGFPSWSERVQHELANRARVAPDIEMTACGNACPDAGCYEVMPPLYYDRKLNRAARFHAAHQALNGFFAHTTPCDLVDDIGTTYPDPCAGAASCSCEGGALNGGTTSFGARVSLFGASASGEIIASGNGMGGFYQWLHEFTDDPQCNFTQENGHRWLLLTSTSSIGFGAEGISVGDFGSGGAAEVHVIPSGSHWPKEGSAVEAWANWHAEAAPSSALINVDGTCTAMTLNRGTGTSGAYRADLSGLAGCSRYFFLFEDAAGGLATFPTTGSLGIGGDDCPDWSAERPPTGITCNCEPTCEGKTCGDDACGGSCGNCDAGSSCSDGGQCVSDATTAAGTGGGSAVGSGGADAGAGGGGPSGPSAGGGDDTGSGSGSGSGSGAGSASGSGSGSGDAAGPAAGPGSGSGPPAGAGGGGDTAEDGDLSGSCDCTTAGTPSSGRGAWSAFAAWVAIALALQRRRRSA